MASKSALFSSYTGPRVHAVGALASGKGPPVETGCGTEPLHFEDAGTQALLRADAGVRWMGVSCLQLAHPHSALPPSLQAQTDPPAITHGDPVLAEGEAPQVARFLASVTPLVCRQLERNVLSGAFDHFLPAVEEGEEDSKCIAALDCTWQQPEDSVATAVPATCLAWSCTGGLLMAGYGAPGDVGWSSHSGGVAVWNVMKRDFDAASPSTSQPEVRLAVDTSVLSLAAHPTRAGVVAGGTLVGEVLVWEVGAAEPLVARSPINEYVHREGVVGLHWSGDGQSLVSVSADGKAAVWAPWGNALAAPLHVYRLAPPSSRLSRRGQAVGGASLSALAGGALLVGTEGGLTLRLPPPGPTPDASAAAEAARVPGGTLDWHPAAAAALAPLPAASAPRVVRAAETHATGEGSRVVTLQLLLAARPPPEHFQAAPATFAHAGHTGPVRAVAGSPHHRALFATGGADGGLAVHSALLRKPPLVLEPVPVGSGGSHVSAVAWSTARPFVLAAGGGDGMVHIFDLLASPTSPSLSLPPAAYGDIASPGSASVTRAGQAADEGPHQGMVGAGGGGVLSLAFHPTLGKLLAVADSAGKVRLWRLGWKWATAGPREPALLSTFMRALISQ